MKESFFSAPIGLTLDQFHNHFYSSFVMTDPFIKAICFAD